MDGFWTLERTHTKKWPGENYIFGCLFSAKIKLFWRVQGEKGIIFLVKMIRFVVKCQWMYCQILFDNLGPMLRRKI